MKKFSPKLIVGSSGSFDTYRSILTSEKVISPNGNPSVEIPIDEYLKLHKRLVSTTKEQRNAIPGMDPMRVDMIVLATIFTNFLIKKFGIDRMIQSAYALKEGAVWKMINSK